MGLFPQVPDLQVTEHEMELSPHFTLDELTRSRTAVKLGIRNVPDGMQQAELKRLATDLLEPIRALLGVPLQINSGFRSVTLNHAVGGVRNSAHLDGRAADFVPMGMNLQDAWEAIKDSGRPFDQLIFEQSPDGATWLHIALPRYGQEPRREAFALTHRPARKATS